MQQQNNIVGYTLQGTPIYGNVPQATPRLTAPMPNAGIQSFQPQQAVANESPMLWVSGFIEAKSYRVAPGSTVVLWDSEEGSNRIYIKSTDTNGVPQKMKVLKYEEVDEDNVEAKDSAAGGALSVDAINDMIENKFEEMYERKMSEKREQYKKQGNKRREDRRDEE